MVNLGNAAALLLPLLPLAYRKLAPAYYSWKTGKRVPLPASEQPPAWLKPTRLVLLFVAVTTCLSQMTLFRPRSIFEDLELPFGAPSSTIFDLLIRKMAWNPDFIPPLVAQLLIRLKTYQGRVLYMHFGDTLAQCEVCDLNSTELLLFQLPGLVAQYAAALFVFGTLTMDSGRDKWRVYLCIFASAAFAGEIYAGLQSWSQDFYLPQKLHLFRYGCFAILSLLAYALPAATSPSPLANIVSPTLNALSSEVETLQSNLSTVSLQRTAVLRDPQLRAKVMQFWSIAQREAEMAGNDAEVQRITRELELHQDWVKKEDSSLMEKVEGAERQEARAYAEDAVESLLRAMAGPPETASRSQ